VTGEDAPGAEYAGDALVEGDVSVGAVAAPGKDTGMAAPPATEALPDAVLPGEMSLELMPFSWDVLPLNDMTGLSDVGPAAQPIVSCRLGTPARPAAAACPATGTSSAPWSRPATPGRPWDSSLSARASPAAWTGCPLAGTCPRPWPGTDRPASSARPGAAARPGVSPRPSGCPKRPGGNGVACCPGCATCTGSPGRGLTGEAAPGLSPRSLGADWPAMARAWPDTVCAPPAATALPETGWTGPFASFSGPSSDSSARDPAGGGAYGDGCGPGAWAVWAGTNGELGPKGDAEPVDDVGPVAPGGGVNDDRAGDSGMPAVGGRPFGIGAPPCRGLVSLLRWPREESMGGKPPWLAFQPRPLVVPISTSGTRREPRATIWVSPISAGCTRPIAATRS
jgi:hypothetical protein